MKDIEKFFKKIKNNFEKIGSSSKSGSDDRDKVPSLTTKDRNLRPPDLSLRVAQATIARNTAEPSSSKPRYAAYRNELDIERQRVEQELEEAEKLKLRFTKQVSLEAPLAAKQVLFSCQDLFPDFGPYGAIEQKIDECLSSAAKDNPAEVAALQVVRGIEKSKLPADIDQYDPEAPLLSDVRRKRRENLVKIVSNLAKSPDEMKFRKLRLSNKLISDLVSIEGCELFFTTCGFKREKIDQEDFLVIPGEDSVDLDHLNKMVELLTTATPIMSELYRDTKVYTFSNAARMNIHRENLPDEFFTHTKEDIKRIQDLQRQKIEDSGMLLTKALREKLAIGELRYYRFVLMRVRFPDNVVVQGTFYANDTIATLRRWLTDECLGPEFVEFQLLAPPGTNPTAKRQQANSTTTINRLDLEDFSATLTEMGLAPCSVLTIRFPQSCSNLLTKGKHYIRAELYNQTENL